VIYNIELTDFKKHDNLSLAFVEGLNSLTGENASGKSTVLKAINYGLFGVTQNKTKPHLTRRGADAHRVKLEMRLDGRTTCIERTSRSAKATQNGQTCASGTTAVTAFVEEALGLTAKDYLMLTYSQQGEPQALLDMGATLLQRKIEELSQMQTVDKVLERISTDVASQQADLDAIESMIAQAPDLSVLKQQKEKVRQELTVVQQQIDQAMLKQAELETVIQGSKSQRQQYEAQFELHYNYRVRLSHLQTEQTRKQGELSAEPDPYELDEIQRKLVGIETNHLQAVSHRDNLYSLMKNRKNLETRLNSLVIALPSLKAAAEQAERAEAGLKDVQRELAEADTLLAVKHSDMDRIQEDWRKSKDSVAKSHCATCKRPFDVAEHQAAVARMAELDQEIHQAQQGLVVLIRHRDSLLEKMATLRKQFDPQAVAQYQQRLALLDMVVQEVGTIPVVTTAQCDAADASVTKLSARKKECSQALNEMQRQIDRNTWIRSELARLQQETDRLLQQQAALPLDYESLQQQLDSLQSKIDAACATQMECKQVAADQQAQRAIWQFNFNQLEQDELRFTEYAVRSQQIKKKLAQVKSLQSFLRSRRAQWLHETWDNLLQLASFWLSTVSALSNLERTDSGDFTVQENGVTVPVSELSGAQRSLVGICLRIALSRVFYGKTCPLLLDEPSADCSDSNAARLAGLLRGLGQQVILVSHRGGDVQQSDFVFNFEDL